MLEFHSFCPTSLLYRFRTFLKVTCVVWVVGDGNLKNVLNRKLEKTSHKTSDEVKENLEKNVERDSVPVTFHSFIFRLSCGSAPEPGVQ
jgi:hypothetical protein